MSLIITINLLPDSCHSLLPKFIMLPLIQWRSQPKFNIQLTDIKFFQEEGTQLKQIPAFIII